MGGRGGHVACVHWSRVGSVVTEGEWSPRSLAVKEVSRHGADTTVAVDSKGDTDMSLPQEVADYRIAL